MKQPTIATFLADVAIHQLTILRDDGVNRHLRFRRSDDSYHMGFDLITWGGHLCYTGDMGTYVFARIEDMFQFFRDDSGRINPSYWSEKVLAADRDGVEKFALDKFRDSIKHWIDQDEDTTDELRAAVQEEILERDFEHEFEAFTTVNEFEHAGFRFTDFFEVNCRDYTYRFIWCCHALVWGIGQFDAAKTQRVAA